MATPPRPSSRTRPIAPRSAKTEPAAPAARASARAAAVPRAANPHADAPATRASARNAPIKSGPSKGFYALIAIGILILGSVFTINPIRRSMALSTLDSFKNDGENPAAITAADSYLALVGDHPNVIASAIRQDVGPVTAQIHLAKKLKLFTVLMIIAERPLKTDSSAGISEAERISALNTGAAIYDSEKNGDDLLPDDIKKWAQHSGQSREIAQAAIQVLIAAKPKYVVQLLTDIANNPASDPVLANVAIDGLATLAQSDNLGLLIGLLGGPISDLAVSNKPLTERIINLCNGDHMGPLTTLLEHKNETVRALALEALGGPLMRLGDTPEHVQLRSDLAKRINPKLITTTPPIELAASLKTVRGLRLLDCADAVLALVPTYGELKLPQIDNEVMSDILGRALIPTIPLPETPKDGAKPTAQDEIALRLRAQGDALIIKLTDGLNNENTRTVCAKSLGLIRDKTYLSLRASIDRLAEHGDDAVCMDALHIIVDKSYGRDDVVKRCERSVAKWKKYLDEDRPHFERVKSILDWMRENGKYQIVSDGRARLGVSKDYLQAAQAELDTWLSDPKFLPPLGLTRNRIDGLNQDIKMLGMNVRKAWSGAL